MRLNILVAVCPFLISDNLLSCKKKTCHIHLNTVGAKQGLGHSRYPGDVEDSMNSAEGIFLMIKQDLILPSQNRIEERSL